MFLTLRLGEGMIAAPAVTPLVTLEIQLLMNKAKEICCSYNMLFRNGVCRYGF